MFPYQICVEYNYFRPNRHHNIVMVTYLWIAMRSYFINCNRQSHLFIWLGIWGTMERFLMPSRHSRMISLSLSLSLSLISSVFSTLQAPSPLVWFLLKWWKQIPKKYLLRTTLAMSKKDVKVVSVLHLSYFMMQQKDSTFMAIWQ